MDFVSQHYHWLAYVESVLLSGIRGKSGTSPSCKMKGIIPSTPTSAVAQRGCKWLKHGRLSDYLSSVSEGYSADPVVSMEYKRQRSGEDMLP